MAVLEGTLVRCNRLFPTGSYGFSGGVIQIASMTYSTPTTLAISASTYTNLPYSISFTPKRSGNKFLIYTRWCGEVVEGWNTTFCLDRNGTKIGNTHTDGLKNPGIAVPVMSYAAAASNNDSTPEACQFWFSDSPNTSSTLTYTPVIRSSAAQTFRINRTWTDSNTSSFERMISGMIVLEVSQ